MGLFSSAFGFGAPPSLGTTTELPDIFPMPCEMDAFVKIDMQAIFSKILNATLDRTDGLKTDQIALLADNCLANEKSDGVVSLLAKAMTERGELFLVYLPALKLIRVANQQEKEVIRNDYAKSGESRAGVYISFKNYTISQMLKIYSMLEYLMVSGLYKSGNISKAIQIKVSDLRASVANMDSEAVIAQGVAIATGLGKGKDVLVDAKDTIETAKPDTTAAEKTIALITQKRSFYLGLPAAFITGEQKSGMSDTGNAEMKAIERGLKSGFFNPIIRPLMKAIFGIEVTFVSEDISAVTQGITVLQGLETTSEEFISSENKLKIVNKVFGLPPGSEGDPAPEVLPPAPPPEV